MVRKPTKTIEMEIKIVEDRLMQKGSDPLLIVSSDLYEKIKNDKITITRDRDGNKNIKTN